MTTTQESYPPLVGALAALPEHVRSVVVAYGKACARIAVQSDRAAAMPGKEWMEAAEHFVGELTIGVATGEPARAALACSNLLAHLSLRIAPDEAVPYIATAPTRAGWVYLAGPMTGIAEYNFPAFNAAAAALRAEGLSVVNPADHGVQEGVEWADYLRYDLTNIAHCESIALLPGWSHSKGARLEVHVARALGMPVRFLPGAEAEPASPQAQGDAPEPTPPFGSKRAAALALYKPPFKFSMGYIYDGGSRMVADQDGFGEDSKVFESVAARVRGWGRIGYMPDAEQLQDEVGAVIAEALTEFWNRAARASKE